MLLRFLLKKSAHRQDKRIAEPVLVFPTRKRFISMQKCRVDAEKVQRGEAESVQFQEPIRSLLPMPLRLIEPLQSLFAALHRFRNHLGCNRFLQLTRQLLL